MGRRVTGLKGLFTAAALGLAAGAGLAWWKDRKKKAEFPAIAEEDTRDLEHSIGLVCVGNARELGGYPAADEKKVKSGCLLRSAALNQASVEDIYRLKEVYHLAEVIDFRMSDEVGEAPDPEIFGVNYRNLRILPEEYYAENRKNLNIFDFLDYYSDKYLGRLKMAIKMGVINSRMYVDFLSDEMGKKGYREMFEVLLSMPEDQAFLIHCTQGKDRTGLGAMLILSALGVDEDIIMEDYLLTNKYNEKRIESQRQYLIDSGYEGDELELMMTGFDAVNPEWMENALGWLRENYGSARGYIITELGISEEQIGILKDRFLI